MAGVAGQRRARVPGPANRQRRSWNTSPPSALAKVYGAIALALDHPREMDARISQHESTSGMGRASRTHSTSRRTTLSILVKMANMAMEGTIRCPRDVS